MCYTLFNVSWHKHQKSWEVDYVLLKDFLSFTSDAVPCLVLQLKRNDLWCRTSFCVVNIFLFLFPCFEQMTAIKFLSHRILFKTWVKLGSFKCISGILQYVCNCWAWRKFMSIFITLFLLMFKHCICNAIDKETAWLVQSNTSLKLHFHRNFNLQCLAFTSVPHGKAKTKSKIGILS